MTDTEEEPSGVSEIQAHKWSWWLLPSMTFTLWANILRSFASFYEDLALAFACHMIWREERRLEKSEQADVSRFREQLADL